MGRLTVFGVTALLAVTTAVPAEQYSPSPYDPPSATPNPWEPSPPPKTCGNEIAKVQMQKNSLSDRLKCIGFQMIPVPGGNFYLSPSPDVIIQPPSILVRPPQHSPITTPAMTIQPPQSPPHIPRTIIVRPSPLHQIYSPQILAKMSPLSPITPPSTVVRTKSDPVQPASISVTQPHKEPLNPSQITLRQPSYPSLQAPMVSVSMASLKPNEDNTLYSSPNPMPCESFQSYSSPSAMPYEPPSSYPLPDVSSSLFPNQYSQYLSLRSYNEPFVQQPCSYQQTE